MEEVNSGQGSSDLSRILAAFAGTFIIVASVVGLWVATHYVLRHSPIPTEAKPATDRCS